MIQLKPFRNHDHRLKSMLLNDRVVISSLDKEFARLHSHYCSLIRAIPEEGVYRNPQGSEGRFHSSVGDILLRGAAAVEQTFGGITANLWDDPFEWTLPENLSTRELIIEYLEEVEATRRRAFVSFVRDADLLKEIMGPAAETRLLIDLLAETLVKTAEFYGHAAALLRLLTQVTAAERPG
jgi:hypothetical protein